MVQSCGGFEAVAQEIGLVYADNVISSQYPTFEALAVEVRSFLENRALELDYAQVSEEGSEKGGGWRSL